MPQSFTHDLRVDASSQSHRGVAMAKPVKGEVRQASLADYGAKVFVGAFWVYSFSVYLSKYVAEILPQFPKLDLSLHLLAADPM